MRDPGATPGGTSHRLTVLRGLGTLLSLALLVYLIQAQGWDEFRGALGRLPWYVLVIGLALIFGSRICITLRWLTLLRAAGARMGFLQSFRLTFMGLFASNFLPSTVGGDLVRLTGAVGLGVDAGISAASLVVDRLIGMLGMAVLAPLGLYLVLGQGAGSSSLLAAPVLGVAANQRRAPLVRWAGEKARGFWQGMKTSSAAWLRKPSSLALALLYSFGHMLFTFLAIELLLRGMGESISLLWIGALWSLSYFVSLAPVSINGLGLQEVSITMLYSRFGGVSLEAALALAVLMRLVFLLASLPGALFLPDILRPLAALRRAETSERKP